MLQSNLSLATACLGLFLLLPLFALSRQRRANIWLGLFIYSISSLSFADYLIDSGVIAQHPRLWGIFDWPLFCIGPFLYLYVRSMVGLSNGWRQFWHFLPLMLTMPLLLSVWFFIPLDQLTARMQAAPSLWVVMLFFFAQLLAISYVFAVFYRLRQHRKNLRLHYSSIHQRSLNWLRWLLLINLALLLIWLPATSLGGVWLWGLYIGRIACLYAMGWYAIRQPALFLAEISVAEPVQPPPEQPASPVAEREQGNAKYARSGMSEAAQQLIGERLQARMQQQRDYLENDLKLSELAERIGTSPQLLSQYLNDVLGQNFFDYINSQRVAEVQRLMKSRSHDALTLLDLAFAAGFNSKSTFNAAFKKISGLAPSSWRSQYGRTP